MEVLRLALGGVALACGLLVIVINWLCVVYGRSWVPLIGGALGCTGLALLPVVGVWWAPVLIDFGTAPGLALTVVAYACRRRTRG